MACFRTTRRLRSRSRALRPPARCARAACAPIPETGAREMWLIEYEVDGGPKRLNHYLAGKAPFRLADYQRWFQKLRIDNSWTSD